MVKLLSESLEYGDAEKPVALVMILYLVKREHRFWGLSGSGRMKSSRLLERELRSTGNTDHAFGNRRLSNTYPSLPTAGTGCLAVKNCQEFFQQPCGHRKNSQNLAIKVKTQRIGDMNLPKVAQHRPGETHMTLTTSSALLGAG